MLTLVLSLILITISIHIHCHSFSVTATKLNTLGDFFNLFNTEVKSHFK